MASIVVFITGANRGLGQGLVKYFIAKPDHIVIAAVRDPTHSTAQALAELPAGKGSRIIVVKYDASVEQSALMHLKKPAIRASAILTLSSLMLALQIISTCEGRQAGRHSRAY
ncbi:hypothetical protein ACN42_g8387 [Penicillium freii]|uniref:Uncharacterized protein n=1 Tax=Penicillium freii TaxID=48697 RepID=A0A124GQP2_PENFR|nr:hypothetical protein ACN42_g8387 [Penicillium freii]